MPVKSSRWLAARVAGVTTTVALLGLAAEVAGSTRAATPRLVELFSLSYEGNVPTWYASSLLLSCGLLLAAISAEVARSDGPFGTHWRALSGIFIYMSLDEAVEIHEHLAFVADYVHVGGVLHFAWVIPGAIIVAVVGALYLPFVRHLPTIPRRRFVTAGCLYLAGALLMELPLGWWTEQAGSDNLVYGLLDFVEETLELAGASWFLVSLWAYRAALQGGSS